MERGFGTGASRTCGKTPGGGAGGVKIFQNQGESGVSFGFGFLRGAKKSYVSQKKKKWISTQPAAMTNATQDSGAV